MGIFDEVFDDSYDLETELATNGGGGKLPTGRYKMVITESGQQEDSYGPEGCVDFWFRLDVVEGEHEGRRLVLYPRLLNPEDKDDYRVKNGRKEFAVLCKGCGFTAPPSDSSDMHDIPFDLEIELKTAKSGKQYHVLKSATPDGVGGDAGGDADEADPFT